MSNDVIGHFTRLYNCNWPVYMSLYLRLVRLYVHITVIGQLICLHLINWSVHMSV